jgi:hypothetical protein
MPLIFIFSYILYSFLSLWFNFFIPLIAIQSYQLLVDAYQYQQMGYTKFKSLFMSSLVVFLTMVILALYILT